MTVIKKLFTLPIVSIAILSMCAGCRTLPQSPAAGQQAAEEVIAEPAPLDTAGPTAAQSRPNAAVGTARYYANRFNGRKTASGEIFSQKKLTAAHPTLPFGTLVKVENLANSKSVIVKINDRCRKHEKVFIDVSREAALELDFIKQGTAKVRITIVEKNPPDEASATAQD